MRALVGESRRAVDADRARDAGSWQIDKVVEFHGNRLIELEERIREAGALVAAGVVPPGAAGTPDPGAGPAWEPLVAQLASEDAAVRLQAAYDLGETGDLAVVPHLLPMLADADVFVRMVTAQALDTLQARLAVPSLIDRLGDDTITVREAALIALRNITGQRFGYEPDARQADRDRKVDQWRAWWRREGDDFLSGGGADRARRLVRQFCEGRGIPRGSPPLSRPRADRRDFGPVEPLRCRGPSRPLTAGCCSPLHHPPASMGIFKAYDIRGVVPSELDPDTARKIGHAFARRIEAKRLLVGQDMRTHSPEIAGAVIDGMLDAGADVVSIGLASTPMTYFAIGSQDVDGGLCVTASHNGGEYNGMKLCGRGATPISKVNGIGDIETMCQDPTPGPSPRAASWRRSTCSPPTRSTSRPSWTWRATCTCASTRRTGWRATRSRTSSRSSPG